MEKLQRLNELWSWLPAFRAVAETEHLPTASKLLRVSPSALSRSIRLLEDRVGKKLFSRERGHLYLNEDGVRFLATLREAMRGVDDGIDDLREETVTGAVRVSAQSSISLLFVLPALTRMREQHPDLVPELYNLGMDEMNARLSRGTLDLAILDDPKPRRGLLTERLLPLRPGVYCGPGHPLYGVQKVTLEEVQAHPFVAPPQAGDDDWPEDIPRKIGMHVNVLYLGVLTCASARLLACLPAPVADAYGEVHGSGVQLWRVPIDVCRESWLYAVRRHPVGKRGRAELVLEAIRHEVEARRNARAPKR